MIGGENIFQRAFIFLFVIGALFFLLKIPNRQLKGKQSALFKFILWSYTFTYFTGSSIIYLFGQRALDLYFGIAPFTLRDSDIETFFFLSLIPFIALILIPVLPIFKLGRSSTTFDGKHAGVINHSPFSSTILTVFLVLALSASIMGGATIRLLVGSLSLTESTGARSLYEARSSAMSGLSFLQGGVLYGTLPSLTTGLLLYSGRHAWLMRIPTYFCLVLTILLNLGLQQTAPLFAFAFIYVSLNILMGANSLLSFRTAVFFVISFVGYVFYSSIKATREASSIPFYFLEIVMRMPIAGPYLVSMRDSSAGNITSQDYIPRDLGWYMFPEFASSDRIAMPQPAFMETWYVFGVIASIFLLIVSIIFAFFLIRYLSVGPSSNSGFVSVTTTYSLFHYVYYTFQTGHLEVLVSSYAFLFPLLPTLVFIGLRLILRQSRTIKVHPL